jgi:hypothetical protein
MKSHVHHTIPRSRGGTDESWNLVELDPYTHAYEHALDFVLFDHAPKFDYRHEAWPLLPEDLKEAVKKRHAEWNSAFFSGREVTAFQREASRQNIKIALSSRSKEQDIEQGRINGKKCAEMGLGICAPENGALVSENMRNLVSRNEHWFQTPEHSARVSASNQKPHTCDICGKIIKGLGPLSLHIKSHQNDHLKEQIKNEYIPRGKGTGYGNLSELAKKYQLDKSTIARIIKENHEN